MNLEIVTLDPYECTFEYNDKIYSASFKLHWECYEGEVEVIEILDSKSNPIELEYDTVSLLESMIEELGDRKQWIMDFEEMSENNAQIAF